MKYNDDDDEHIEQASEAGTYNYEKSEAKRGAVII